MDQDERIEAIMAEYRPELLREMNFYHGCDRHGGNPCRADVYRVDHVILPVVRKMLEDAIDNLH